MSTTVYEQIIAELRQLPESSLHALLDVLRRTRDGRPIRRWSPAVGSLTDEEAAAMRQAIDEGCEDVNFEAW